MYETYNAITAKYDEFFNQAVGIIPNALLEEFFTYIVSRGDKGCNYFRMLCSRCPFSKEDGGGCHDHGYRVAKAKAWLAEHSVTDVKKEVVFEPVVTKSRGQLRRKILGLSE